MLYSFFLAQFSIIYICASNTASTAHHIPDILRPDKFCLSDSIWNHARNPPCISRYHHYQILSCLNRPGIARFDPFVHTEQFFLQAAGNPLCYIFTVSRSWKINNHVISSSRRFILIKRYHIRSVFSISAEALLQYHWSVFHQTHHIQKVKKHHRFLCGAARKYSDNFMTNLHTNTELFKNLSESYLLNLWLYYKLTFVILSHNNIVKTLLVFPTGFYRLLI